MSAIATGEKPLQYLASLEMEEELMNILFGSVSPGISTEVLTSVLHSFFHRNEDGTVDAVAGSLGSLNWPRLLLLASRILDSRLWDDADKSERANIDACLHLGLCLPSVAREPRLVAAVVTVGRYVSLCARNMESVDDAERGYREYDKWLGQTVNVGSKATIKSLVACLTHLVPIEPSRFLRANVKILLRLRRGDIVGDYIALAKTKLADVDADPAADNDGNGVAARADAEREARAIGDVMKYVVEFMRGNSVMPSSLVRQMTFHRYHFRASLLEPLLSADLSPSPEFLEAHIPDATIQTFNKERIAMIKQMAFKRKDKAVTKEEATGAVEQINAKMRALSAEGAGAAGVDATRALDCHLTADSSPESLIRGLALSATDPSTVARSTADGNASGSQPASDRLCRLLASKLASMGRAKGADVMKIVSSVLETVLQEIFSSSRPCYRRGKAGLQTDGARKQSGSRGDLLHRTLDTPVPWVNRFLVDVLGDCRLAGQRHALQQRLLVLLCVQTAELSPDHAEALGIFLFCLFAQSAASSLHDLVHVLVDEKCGKIENIIDFVSERLMISSPNAVKCSGLMALTFIQLAIAHSWTEVAIDRCSFKPPEGKENVAPGEASLPEDASDDGEQAASLRLPGDFVRLLRWVISSGWRLFTVNLEFGGADGRLRPGGRSDGSGQASFLISEAVSVLQAPLCSKVSLDAAAWSMIELRAGWGNPVQAASVLRRFASLKSVSFLHVLGGALKSISSAIAGSQQRIPTSWLILALSTIAHESLSLIGLESDDIGSGLLADADFCVRATNNRKRKKETALAVLTILDHLPACLYFGGCSRGELESHLSRAVGPALWPPTLGTIKTLAKAFLSWTGVSSPAGKSFKCAPAFLVVGMAIHWPAVASLRVVSKVLESGQVPDALLKAKATWKVIHSSFLLSGVSNRNAALCGMFTQVTASTSGMAGVTDQDFVALVGCILFSPSILLSHQSDSSLGAWRPRLKSFIEEMSTVLTSQQVADFLDIVLDLAASAPLSGSFRQDARSANEILCWSMVCLEEAFAARLSLLEKVPTACANFFQTAKNSGPRLVALRARVELGLGGRALKLPMGLRLESHSQAQSFSGSEKGVERDEVFVDALAAARMAVVIGRLDMDVLAKLSASCGSPACSGDMFSHLIDAAVDLDEAVKSAGSTSRAHQALASCAGCRCILPAIQNDLFDSIEQCQKSLAKPITVLNPKFRRLNPSLYKALTAT